GNDIGAALQGSGEVAADDNQTTIPTTNERKSRDWKREYQRPESGDEPADGAQVFEGRPIAGRTASQAHLADADRSAGEDLAQSPSHVVRGPGFGGQGLVRTSGAGRTVGDQREESAHVSAAGQTVAGAKKAPQRKIFFTGI